MSNKNKNNQNSPNQNANANSQKPESQELVEQSRTVTVTSNHDSKLILCTGDVVEAGKSVKVEDSVALMGNSVTKTWIDLKVIEVK